MIAFSIAAFLWLCTVFAFIMWVKPRAAGKWWAPITLYLLVYPFVLCDWLFNITVLTVLFIDRPGEWNELVTGRMKRYKKTYLDLADSSNGIKRFRYGFAVRLCEFLNKHDMEHC